MANHVRGEELIKIERNGQELEYTLAPNTGAILELESKLKKGFLEIFNEAAGGTVTNVVEIAKVFLQRHHKEEYKTILAVAEFCDEAGGMEVVMEVVGRVMAANKPKAAEGKSDPQVAQLGTGGAST